MECLCAPGAYYPKIFFFYSTALSDSNMFIRRQHSLRIANVFVNFKA